MYESLAVNSSDTVREKLTELNNIVLEDPMYREFVQNGGSWESLRNYVQGNSDLSFRLGNLFGAIEQFKDLSLDILMPLNVHQGICMLNRVNGYQLSKEVNMLHVNERLPETTEKTEGASLTEMAYAFMEERNYADIQTDPNARMLLHLAHLSERMMDKMAEVARLSELEKAEKKMSVPQENADQKRFFAGLTDAEELDCILDDEKMTKKLESNKAEIAKNSEIIRKFRKDDVETKKQVLKAALTEEETLRLTGLQADIRKKYNEQRDEELKNAVDKYRKDLIRTNEDNQWINDEIREDNIKNSEFNAELDRQIEDLKHKREEKLKDIKDKEAEVEQLRQQRKEGFKEQVKTYYAKKEEVPDRVDRLQNEFNAIVQFSEVSKYLSSPNSLPPQQHFDEMEALQMQADAIEYVQDLMFRLSGNDRSAKAAMWMLEPKAVKEVKELRKKLNDAVKAEEAANDELLAEKAPEKMQKKHDKAKALTAKRLEAQEQFEPMKNAADLQDAMADLWKKNPELQKEYQKIGKKSPKLNSYEILRELSKNNAQKISETKGKYGVYYNNQGQYQQLIYRLNDGKMRTLEELDTVRTELEQAKNELAALKKPDEKAYEKETEALCREIYDPKEEKKSVEEINASTDKAIQRLEEQRIMPEEERPVLDQKSIDDKVAQKKEQLTLELDHVYEVWAECEIQKLMNSEGNKLMNAHVQKLGYRCESLSRQSDFLQGKREVAKDHYDKVKSAFDKQERVKGDWQETKTKKSKFADLLERDLDSMSKNILKGKTPKHNDTTEFTQMKDALQSAHDYLQQNKDKITDLDEGCVTEFKRLLSDMNTKAADYYALKQKGIHWRPSNMRFVRLDMSKRLQSFANDAADRLDKMQALKAKEQPIQEKADSFNIPDPGKDYREYTIQQAPKEIVAQLAQKRSAEKKHSELKQASAQNSKENSLGGKVN